MSYMLHLKREEDVVLGAGIVNRLIEYGDGDAALLYLCLARSGAAEPEKLRETLRWDERRFSAAEGALHAMGLIAAPSSDAPAPARTGVAPQPETALPEYSREDVMNKLESDTSFASLLGAVEARLGKLSDPSVKKLLGLYDYLGLPANVIYLLVNWCIERKAEQFGEGRLPTMREIEKEGYAWARLELFSHAAADAYIKREQKKRGQFPEYMAALHLGGRAAAPSEEKYLGQWTEWGFPPETVAIAYDRTVLRCHEFKWPYCNGILKRWHEKGLHTPEAVSAENAPQRGQAQPAPGAESGKSKNAWMKDYN